MHKVLDNTFLSAVKGEIKSVDVLSKVRSEYDLISTSEVICESSAGGPLKNYWKKLTEEISIVDMHDSDYLRVMDYLKRTNQWIGKGELSVIICSMILTHRGIENYIVTDDKRARGLIIVVHDDPFVSMYIGFVPTKISYAGTIGLIVHMREKGRFTKEECTLIKEDVKNSSFRVNDRLLSLLD